MDTIAADTKRTWLGTEDSQACSHKHWYSTVCELETHSVVLSAHVGSSPRTFVATASTESHVCMDAQADMVLIMA